MPNCLVWIDFIMSVIGFFITIATLKTARSVKKRLLQKAEYTTFQHELRGILDQIQGFLDSINIDHIYKTDRSSSFQWSISQFLTDLESRFSFLNKKSIKHISKLQQMIIKSKSADSEWLSIARELIILKNLLSKEDAYHE